MKGARMREEGIAILTKEGSSMEHKHIIQAAVRLFDREPAQTLAPAHGWDDELGKLIHAMQPGKSEHARALKAGLLLWNDQLDDSHTIAQSLDTQEGSYWHGIMHRMEKDYSNAKYWFVRTGKHAIYPTLLTLSQTIVAQSREELERSLDDLPSRKSAHRRACMALAEWGSWDAAAYVHLVETQLHEDDETSDRLLRLIQRTELALLLDHSYYAEFGGRLFESLVRSESGTR